LDDAEGQNNAFVIAEFREPHLEQIGVHEFHHAGHDQEHHGHDADNPTNQDNRL
jgi:hypothetical protein